MYLLIGKTKVNCWHSSSSLEFTSKSSVFQLCISNSFQADGKVVSFSQSLPTSGAWNQDVSNLALAPLIWQLAQETHLEHGVFRTAFLVRTWGTRGPSPCPCPVRLTGETTTDRRTLRCPLRPELVVHSFIGLLLSRYSFQTEIKI